MKAIIERNGKPVSKKISYVSAVKVAFRADPTGRKKVRVIVCA